MEVSPWELFWFIVVVASIGGYAVLDGFDLGVGMLHLFVKRDEERRLFLNAIGPVWDGNEVWLVIVIGALFAGFPIAYATLFSAFYLPLILLVCALIFRAVAIEFRSKQPMGWWRRGWDRCFFGGSLLIAFGVGMTLGNLAHGIPIDEHGVYQGDFLTFFRPYPLLVGCLGVATFTMHGVLFLVMKTEGALHERMRRWVLPSSLLFIFFYLLTTVMTLLFLNHMGHQLRTHRWLLALPIGSILAIVNIPYQLHKGRNGTAFLLSCGNILFLLLLFALGAYPYLIRSTLSDGYSISVANAGASQETLEVLAIIVAIGIPLVIAYGFWIYHIFRGKVKLDATSY